MAKLPEVAIKEQALKALEKQKKEDAKREEKEKIKQKKIEDEEKKLKQTAKNIAKARTDFGKKYGTDKKIKGETLELLNPEVSESEEVKRLDITGFKMEEDPLSFAQISEDETRHKVCVEVEKTDKKSGEKKVQDKQHSIKWSKKEKVYFNNQNENIEKFFFKDGTVPKWSKYQCSCCGKLKKIEEFHKSWSYKDLARMDDGYQFHKSYCKECAKKLYNYHYYGDCEKNEELAMERFCADTDTYWDIECYHEARRIYDNNPTAVSIVNEYIGAVGRDRVPGKTYWDSPTIKNRVFSDGEELKNSSGKSVGLFSMPLDWQKEEVLIRKKILKLLRYDPFENEEDNDRRVMYRNLELMIDDSMSEDFVKLQAAIEIVRGFQRIEKLRRREQEMESAGATPKEILEITKMRTAELKQITDFSKDHGFAARFAQKKAKGAGTLTGCMNDMKESYYEDGLVNYYDVKTCKEMQEAANMSMEAIFKQIALSDNDTYKMIQTQTERIRKLTREVDDLKEQLRKKEIEIKRKELIAEAMKKGVYEEENEEEEKNLIGMGLSSENVESEENKEDIEMSTFLNDFIGEASVIEFEDDYSEDESEE